MSIKTKIIEVPNGTVLVMGGFPDGPIYSAGVDESGEIWINGISVVCLEEPANFKYVGKLSEVKEEDAKKAVEYFYVGDGKPAFENYLEKDRYTNEAKKSLKTLIEANVPLKNKYGDTPPKAICVVGGMELLVKDSMTSKINSRRLSAWKSEEEKVYHNPLIFFEAH